MVKTLTRQSFFLVAQESAPLREQLLHMDAQQYARKKRSVEKMTGIKNLEVENGEIPVYS